MTRQVKAVANRLNARKSTGPKTDIGRKTVSRNAVKHGLSGTLAFTAKENKRIDFLAAAFLEDHASGSHQEFIAREAAEAQVTLERIKKIKNDIWQVLGAKSGQSIEEIANPFADSRIRNDLFELYDEAPPHIQQRIRTLYHRVNRAGTQGANLVDDLVCIELLKLRRYEQNAANRRDKSLKQLTI